MERRQLAQYFKENKDTKETDELLIEESLAGNRYSLEKLILRHQAWIYNIAFKMVMDHDDAADITQEILIKAVTSLSSYDSSKAAFRTWLYRITANHVITMKKKKFENRIYDIERYVSLIEQLPDDRSFSHPEKKVLEEEVKAGCMHGMLMCLERRERLVFILGGIFGITDTAGSGIMEISRANFRKILSRARKKIYSHINGLCGLVDPANPCRCSHKAAWFYKAGMADPENLRFSKPSAGDIRDMIETRLETFEEEYYTPFFRLYSEQPFHDPPDMTDWLMRAIEDKGFREIFNLE